MLSNVNLKNLSKKQHSNSKTMKNNTSQTETTQDQAQEIKAKCTEAVLKALDDYHFPGMGTAELKTIVANVIASKVQVPDCMEEVEV